MNAISIDKRTNGYSGADCAALIREAGLAVIKEWQYQNKDDNTNTNSNNNNDNDNDDDNNNNDDDDTWFNTNRFSIIISINIR